MKRILVENQPSFGHILFFVFLEIQETCKPDLCHMAGVY